MNLLKSYRGMYAVNSVVADAAEITVKRMTVDEAAIALVELDTAHDTLKGCDIATARILSVFLNRRLGCDIAPMSV